ncbi:hypothetical protein EV424DRAFT_1323615 [Suillus variegatus]|nr:hypothetical protein EV424DRAFT_1323615 [Suillus variegatus]
MFIPSLDTANSYLQLPLYSRHQPNTSQDSDISELQDQVRELESQVRAAESKVQAAESKIRAAEAHCTMALSEVDAMKKKLNSHTGKKKTCALNINAHWLTSAQGLKECEEQEMAKEATWKKKEEAQERAAARKAAQQAAHAQGATSTCFTGSLSTKNKDDLIGIAGALQISTAGIKPELLRTIKEHFESHPEVKNNECFSGLFASCSCTGQKQTFNEGPSDENGPPATHPCLNIPPTSA